MTKTEFLDLYFDLQAETYKPYNKPNNTPQYIHKDSNHPPSVLKSIPEGVNKRLSSRSSNEEMFNLASPLFQEALDKSGYQYKLKFKPTNQQPRPKNRNRKRNITWFNPPYNTEAKTNLGKEFLKLVDECFPPNHKLSKIINRKTIKVSYSTTQNMQKLISGKNSKILSQEENISRKCNCPKNATCPLNGQCLENNIIYHAKVTQRNQRNRNYIGLASTDFKARLGVHKQTFKDKTKSQTSISNHIHELKSENIDFEISWRIVEKGSTFTPVTNVCNLCNKEKFHILFNPGLADLNSKSEFFSHCRHKRSRLLVKRPKKGHG